MAGALTSYIIPVGDLSLDQRTGMRNTLDDNLLQTLINRNVKTDRSQLVVRNVMPLADVGIAGAGQSWLIPGPSVVGTEIVYINSLLNAVTAVGFYGAAIVVANNGITRLRFLLNAADVRAVMSVEELEGRLEPVGYFANQQIYSPQDTITVGVLPKAVFASQTFVLLARIAEPRGILITAQLAL